MFILAKWRTGLSFGTVWRSTSFGGQSMEYLLAPLVSPNVPSTASYQCSELDTNLIHYYSELKNCCPINMTVVI